MARKKKSLEQRLSEDIAEFGIVRVKQAIDMIYYVTVENKKKEKADAVTAT
jgi:hypothetical protein